MQVKKQQLKPDMEQMTGSKLGKEYQSCVLTPYLFNFYAEYIMQNPGCMNYKQESRLQGEIPTISDMEMIPL